MARSARSTLSRPHASRASKAHGARLIVSESELSADMLYATGFRAPDPFVWTESRGRTSVLLSDLEIDRGRREAQVDEVVSLSALEKSLAAKSGRKPSQAEVIAAFLKERGASRPLVPADFPLGLARSLEAHGVNPIPSEGMFQPEREIKSPEEVNLLGKASRITEAGMERAMEVLRAASVGPGKVLLWGGARLTAERLRLEIEGAILRAGGIPGGNTIVACGEQACDPHERGHGPLRAGKLLILDIFPRSRSGYYGDMTRTVVRGTATPEQRRLWETCLRGQQLALRSLRPGADGGAIHRAVTDFFTAEGYPTRKVEGRGGEPGRWSGFFHGTGHGLGLDLHESPRFGAATLRAGNVFTIEPGIYIPGLGGVRHEDVALITPRGYRLLSRFPKPLEI
jgi:Xaa-Pro aminopeptidase